MCDDYYFPDLDLVRQILVQIQIKHGSPPPVSSSSPDDEAKGFYFDEDETAITFADELDNALRSLSHMDSLSEVRTFLASLGCDLSWDIHRELSKILSAAERDEEVSHEEALEEQLRQEEQLQLKAMKLVKHTSLREPRAKKPKSFP